MNKAGLGESTNKVINVIGSVDEAVSIAKEIAVRVAKRAKATDEDRMVSRESIKEINESGLFGIVRPRFVGGSELGFSALVKVTAEISAVCGSSGWVYGVLAGHSWMLNLFPAQAQYDVLEQPEALTATVFRLGGEVTEVEGGYRLVDGRGAFCSGIDHSSWVIVGNTVIREGQAPEPRFFLVPIEDVEVVDDWFTAGMRGTGSRTIVIKDAFIPAHRSVSLEEMMSGKAPGTEMHSDPLYRLSFTDVSPFSIVGAPLGMALGAVRQFAEMLSGKLADADEVQLAQSSATLVRLSAASAEIDSALALVLEDARMIDERDDPTTLSSMERARFPRDWAYGVQTARHAVNEIFEAVGGSGIYSSSSLQRIWRDVNSAAQHFAFGWDSAMSNYGRQMVGKSPVNFTLKKKS